MSIFGKLFEKKECDVCGSEIGLLGKKKLEDGIICKECASRLSPWFNDRRHSTLAEIKDQLQYREENRNEVASFNITKTFGDSTKIHFDEKQGKFLVTSSRKLEEANPDVLRLSQVTGARLDIDENRTELMDKTEDGKEVSFNPPRYELSYYFYIVINVNTPYFDEIKFRLNTFAVEVTPPASGGIGLFGGTAQDPSAYARSTPEYQKYEKMGNEIVEMLSGRSGETEASVSAKKTVKCPFCSATTVPDADGCCEYCGEKLE